MILPRIGWKSIIPGNVERWSTGQGELPPMEVGSRVTAASLVLKDGRTTPPQPISEVELITLMDRNGIGTDATIAQYTLRQFRT
jgi:DNA topoisomerase-3